MTKKKSEFRMPFECKNLRRMLPYGILQDANGKCVFFNRDYQVLKVCGQKEFEVDDSVLLFRFYPSADRFIACDDGSTYVGSMYFLYDDETSPLYKEQSKLGMYLGNLVDLLGLFVSTIGNAWDNGTITPLQTEIIKCKQKYLRENNEQDK